MADRKKIPPIAAAPPPEGPKDRYTYPKSPDPEESLAKLRRRKKKMEESDGTSNSSAKEVS